MPKLGLLDRVRESIRVRQYSTSTEKSYTAWVRRYILFLYRIVLKTTMIYTHVVERGALGVLSPLDR